MNNYLRWLMLLVSLLAAASSARAEVALNTATPNPAQSGTPVTLNGTADCAQVYVSTGDPASSGGTLVSVNSATQTFSLTHAYPQSGSYMAEVIQIPSGACATADGNSANNFLTVTVVDTGAVSATPVGPTANGPSPAAPLGLQIEHVELYFDAGSARTQVARNQRGLKLHARIRYRGTGLFQGVWEVDGRRYAYVAEYLNYGDSITLTTPAAPELPTFSPGAHRVGLRILDPQTFIAAVPVAVYFVDAAPAAQPPPTLLAPASGSALNDGATEFRWSGATPDTRYRIDFFAAEPSTQNAPAALFSAYTNTPEYTLKSAEIENFFVPGSAYWWQVSAIDTRPGKPPVAAAALPTGRITVPVPATRVPGQLLIVTAVGTDITQQLKSFALRELESYELEVVGLQVGLYATERDITPLLNELQRIPEVKIAQPNFVFRTAGDPLAAMQATTRRLHLETVHARLRGKNARVAIIDSGVDAQHPDLRARIAVRKNFVSGDDVAAEIHGTAVAGIIAASADDFGMVGVAPEASVLALRACVQSRVNVSDAQCNSTSVSRALGFALQQGAQLVNMSFGTAETDPLIDTLLTEGARRGALLVAPVGNARWQEQASFPARHPAVIAVGGVDERGAPYPNVKLVAQARVNAPATQVFSTVPGQRHNFVDGTSFAAATVSGILALAIDKQASAQKFEIPPFSGDLCAWQEQLLEMEVCR